MKRKLIVAVGVILVTACSGTDIVAPQAQRVTTRSPALEEEDAAAPVNVDNTPPVCDKGSPGFVEFITHAPPEVIKRICSGKKADETL